ncbi:Ankyrin repeat protein [Pandoravirus kuranda]|uniref:Ankyrin repeat protein n=1 Tax=Pandoravirus kuranda TaxID=3019033 RepID=A0AA95J7P9_9VIRU|nr:Ankyrin repeat protein [Pandoravirus kuranda]
MDDLPDEVLALFFAPLSCPERVHWVVPVCKRWRAVASDRGATGRPLCTEAGLSPADTAAQFDPQRKRQDACERALALGHVGCLFYMRPPNGELDEQLWRFVARFPVDAAALDMFDRVSRGAQCNDNALRVALAHGRLHCVSLLLKRGAQFISADKAGCTCRRIHRPAVWSCDEAADGETHAVCLRLLLDDAQHVNYDACDEAVAQGHVECLCVLLGHGYLTDHSTAETAAEAGRLDMLRLMHKHNHEWHCFATEGAAEAGQIECLRYLYEIGCPWDESTCSSAARAGRIDCLRFAHERGCPWDDRTAIYAAKTGSLDCLRYAYENGCPWGDDVWAKAAKYGRLDCLRYACESGCRLDWESIIMAASPSASYRHWGRRSARRLGINEGDRAACLAYALAQQDDSRGAA